MAVYVGPAIKSQEFEALNRFKALNRLMLVAFGFVGAKNATKPTTSTGTACRAPTAQLPGLLLHHRQCIMRPRHA